MLESAAISALKCSINMKRNEAHLHIIMAEAVLSTLVLTRYSSMPIGGTRMRMALYSMSSARSHHGREITQCVGDIISQSEASTAARDLPGCCWRALCPSRAVQWP